MVISALEVSVMINNSNDDVIHEAFKVYYPETYISNETYVTHTHFICKK